MYMSNEFNTKEECAIKLDKKDALSRFRANFFIPINAIYVDGNSLGLLSKESENAIQKVVH